MDGERLLENTEMGIMVGNNNRGKMKEVGLGDGSGDEVSGLCTSHTIYNKYTS